MRDRDFTRGLVMTLGISGIQMGFMGLVSSLADNQLRRSSLGGNREEQGEGCLWESDGTENGLIWIPAAGWLQSNHAYFGMFKLLST